jgi:hypothetical protein
MPTYFNRPELEIELVAWLSEGQTLASYCRQDGKPKYRVVYEWMADSPTFAAAVGRAREMGFDAIAEDALRIADTPQTGIRTVTSPDGQTVTREDMTQHRKLQIETRLRLLACWDPRRYGPKQILSGDKDNPIKAQVDFGVFDELLTALTLKRHNTSK